MKHLLFDFDGTLVDSMPSYSAVMLGILDEEGVSYQDDVIKIITPLGLIRTIRYFIENLGVKRSPEEMGEKMKDHLLNAYVYEIPAKNNVVCAIKTLKERGYGLHVLTASPHATLDPCLKRLGLYDLFDNVWSCDDFNLSKSDPKIYLEVAKKLNVNTSDIVFFDDNLIAAKTAKTAGLISCGVYDQSSKETVDQMKNELDHFVYDFGEVLDLNI